jgi:hypothetical protein
MKYILDYLKEEMYIQPVEDAIVTYEEEYADCNIPIGYRLKINGKDVDIVVWYADYVRWIGKKFDKLRDTVYGIEAGYKLVSSNV